MSIVGDKERMAALCLAVASTGGNAAERLINAVDETAWKVCVDNGHVVIDPGTHVVNITEAGIKWIEEVLA